MCNIHKEVVTTKLQCMLLDWIWARNHNRNCLQTNTKEVECWHAETLAGHSQDAWYANVSSASKNIATPARPFPSQTVGLQWEDCSIEIQSDQHVQGQCQALVCQKHFLQQPQQFTNDPAKMEDQQATSARLANRYGQASLAMQPLCNFMANQYVICWSLKWSSETGLFRSLCLSLSHVTWTTALHV